MTPIFKATGFGVALFTMAIPAAAQDWATHYDLSRYAVQSVHEDWRVLCTPEGTGILGAARDCAVENRFGLVIYVYDGGYYAFTRRGVQPGEIIHESWTPDATHGVTVSYYHPSFAAEYLDDAAFALPGQEPEILTGYAEAEAMALSLMLGGPEQAE